MFDKKPRNFVTTVNLMDFKGYIKVLSFVQKANHKASLNLRLKQISYHIIASWQLTETGGDTQGEASGPSFWDSFG